MAKRIQKTISLDTSIILLVDKFRYENKNDNFSDAFNDFINSIIKESEVKTKTTDTAKEIKELKEIISSLVSILEEKEIIWFQK